MLDIIFKGFSEKLKNKYPELTFGITDEIEKSDLNLDCCICEVTEFLEENSKRVSVVLSIYIIVAKKQNDFSNFIVKVLDIKEMLQEINVNNYFNSEKLKIEFGQAKSVETRESLRMARISGSFDITKLATNFRNQIASGVEYIPMQELFINNKEVIE